MVAIEWGITTQPTEGKNLIAKNYPQYQNVVIRNAERKLKELQVQKKEDEQADSEQCQCDRTDHHDT